MLQDRIVTPLVTQSAGINDSDTITVCVDEDCVTSWLVRGLTTVKLPEAVAVTSFVGLSST